MAPITEQQNTTRLQTITAQRQALIDEKARSLIETAQKQQAMSAAAGVTKTCVSVPYEPLDIYTVAAAIPEQLRALGYDAHFQVPNGPLNEGTMRYDSYRSVPNAGVGYCNDEFKADPLASRIYVTLDNSSGVQARAESPSSTVAPSEKILASDLAKLAKK